MFENFSGPKSTGCELEQRAELEYLAGSGMQEVV